MLILILISGVMCCINLLTCVHILALARSAIPLNGVEQESTNTKHGVQGVINVRTEASTTITTTNAANIISNLDRKRKTPYARPSSQPLPKQSSHTNMDVPWSIS